MDSFASQISFIFFNERKHGTVAYSDFITLSHYIVFCITFKSAHMIKNPNTLLISTFLRNSSLLNMLNRCNDLMKCDRSNRMKAFGGVVPNSKASMHIEMYSFVLRHFAKVCAQAPTSAAESSMMISSGFFYFFCPIIQPVTDETQCVSFRYHLTDRHCFLSRMAGDCIKKNWHLFLSRIWQKTR